MLPIHIALTTTQVNMAELSRVAGALQQQVQRDFAPVWGVTATIDAFPFEQIPAGCWPIIVQGVIEAPGSAGLHHTEADDTPYALVLYGDTWSLAASHECLEMLADPSGSRRIAAESLIPHQRRVEYLLEVCAPCASIETAYAIHDVIVSDFCTPRFYGSSHGDGGGYSFSGTIRQPLQVLASGSLTWFADDGLIYQAWADADGRIGIQGGFSTANRDGQSLREFVNGLIPAQRRLSNAEWPTQLVQAEARGAHAARFHDDIAWRFGFASSGYPQRWGAAVSAVRAGERTCGVAVGAEDAN